MSFISTLPNRLSRITSGGKFIKEIDGLRFVAILPVVMYHLTERFERYVATGAAGIVKHDPDKYLYNLGFLGQFQVTHDRMNATSNLINLGFLGVYIFFTISGFILAVPFAAHQLRGARKVNLPNYYLRRVTRLEPTYIIWCTVFFLVYILKTHTSFFENLPHYLATITYTHDVIYNTWSPYNPVTWTLELEVQFYILAPFLAMLFFSIQNKNTRRIVNMLLILVLLVAQSYFGWVVEPYSHYILGYLHYFLIGFMLADIYLCDWSEDRSHHIAFDFVALISLAIFIFSWSWAFQFSNRFVVIVSLFCFFYAGFKSVFVNKFLCNRWITAIGGMCYTIYLIHLPLAEGFVKISKHLHITDHYSVNLLVQLLIFLPLVFIVSSVGFLLFEKPFMDKDWPKKFGAFIRGKKYEGQSSH